MDIERQARGDIHVVVVAGRLDTATSPELERVCLEILDSGATRLVFDLGRVEFMASAGLRVILVTLKRLGPVGGRVAVAGARGVVQESFLIAGFDRLMPVLDDVDAAIGAL